MTKQMNAIIAYKQMKKKQVEGAALAEKIAADARRIGLAYEDAMTRRSPALMEQLRLYSQMLNGIRIPGRSNEILQRFVVNEHIDVCLVKDKSQPPWHEIKTKTMIYIDGKPFRQCMYLILANIDACSEATSMDEIIENTPAENKSDEGSGSTLLTNEESFQGHCSNIQAWVEHDYDVNLLDSRLSLPILKELTRVGDQKASRIYKASVEEMLFGESETRAIFAFEMNSELVGKNGELFSRLVGHAKERRWYRMGRTLEWFEESMNRKHGRTGAWKIEPIGFITMPRL